MLTTNANSFKTCRYDRIFKAIFLTNDFELINALLSNVFNKKITITNYIIPELKIRNKKEKVKTLDVLLQDQDNFYNIEINTHTDNYIKVRNLSYFMSFFSQNTKRGDNYNPNLKFYQINFSFNLNQNYPLISRYKILEKRTLKPYLNTLEIIEINMSLLKKFFTTNITKALEYKYILMLDLEENKLNELKKIGSDKIIMRFIKDLKNINKNIKFYYPRTKDEDMLIVEHSRGYGEAQTKFVKNLIKKNMPAEFILNVCDIHPDELTEMIKKYGNKQ